MKLKACSHYREGDYGTRCKSGFMQTVVCAGISADTATPPCCNIELCGMMFDQWGGKPPEHLIPRGNQ